MMSHLFKNRIMFVGSRITDDVGLLYLLFCPAFPFSKIRMSVDAVEFVI